MKNILVTLIILLFISCNEQNTKTDNSEWSGTISASDERNDLVNKFVDAYENKDLNEILKDFNKYISREKIWLMPAGENQKYLNKNRKKGIDICKKENFKFSNRLQIDIWNQKTGV